MLTFQRSHVYAALLPLAFVTGLAVGFIFWGRGSSAPPAVSAVPTTAAAAAIETTDTPTRYDVPVDDDPVYGRDDAPVTLIEFSDYECPYCQKWHAEVLPRLMETYPEQVRFVFRDFPLSSIHSNAAPAAEAANCAGDQGSYWEYNSLLFQRTLGLGSEALTSYAAQLNLDAVKFKECVDSRRHQAEVEADYEFAANFGIRSTPTFFINGLAVVGAQPFEVFQTVIEKELANTGN
jgi:protein-disulfide isomerase